MSEAPLPLNLIDGYDHDATIKRVQEFLGGLYLTSDQTHRLASTVTGIVFAETSKDIYNLTRTLGEVTKELSATRDRLEDAEITISKIGFCEPTPSEAQRKYEAKYGSLRDIEHKVVKL